MAVAKPFRLDGRNHQVTVTSDGNETVEVRLGEGPDSVTLVGTRFDVHQLIIEADRQLGRLNYRFRGL